MFRREAPALEVPPPENSVFTDPAIPSQACCCPARPVVRVIMPSAAGRPRPVDLWLCGHHYRASLGALCAAGAVVEELTGSADRARAYYADADAVAP
jgi:hypothetical protein